MRQVGLDDTQSFRYWIFEMKNYQKTVLTLGYMGYLTGAIGTAGCTFEYQDPRCDIVDHEPFYQMKFKNEIDSAEIKRQVESLEGMLE
jgi:hypothetical protein